MESKFLLFAETDPSGASLTLWVKNGSKTTARTVPYQTSFLVASRFQPIEDAERALLRDPRVRTMRYTKAVLWLKGEPKRVLEVFPYNYHQMPSIANALRRKLSVTAFEFFNVDIPITSRYLQERGLFPFCCVKEKSGQIVSADDRWNLTQEDCGVKVLRLSVQADAPDDAKTYQTPIARIQLGDHVVEAKGREREALLELGALIQAEDPDIYTTWRGDVWEIPYLLDRIYANGLRGTVNLGRLPDAAKAAMKEKSFHTYGAIKHRDAGWFLRGRLHIDLSNKSLPTADERENVAGVIYLARTANVDPQRLSRSSPGTCIQQTQMDRSREEGVQVPWKRNLVEKLKTLEEMQEMDRGGQIHVPEPGLYGDCWSVDFSGYYPGIIKEYNLSSETIDCDCCPDSPRLIPGSGRHICVRRDGHQARTLRPFVEHRRQLTKMLKDPKLDLKTRTWAKSIKDELKAIGVVCFGYARFKNARYGCAEVHQSIQAIGRDGITRAKCEAEQYGFDRLHTLVDGMIIQKRGATEEEVRHLCRRITHQTGVPLDIDAGFDWVVLLPSKMIPGVGVPNRYYARGRDGKLKLRGIELRRHSTCPWIGQVQEAMLAKLAEARTTAQFHRMIPAAIQIAREAVQAFHDVPLEDLALRATVSKAADEYTQETHVAIALRKLNAAKIDPQPGQTVAYVVLRGSKAAANQRVAPLALLNRAGPLGKEPVLADKVHYARLLARAVETLLSPFGYTETRVVALLQGRATSQKLLNQRTPGKPRELA